MNRRTFLSGIAGAAALAGSRAEASELPPGRLNVIHIGVDTWSTHWLGCYGATHVRTPNVDALARKSFVFADVYPCGLPTIPTRRAIFTGRRVFPGYFAPGYDDPRFRGWHQLYVEDVTMADAIRNAGYTTALITDVYHQFKPGKNFNRGFDSWQYIRGQEMDRYKTAPRSVYRMQDFQHPTGGGGGGMLGQYLTNRALWRTEEDWPCARTFRAASEWVEENLDDSQPFYLHIESYSPHEMWDPPDHYYHLYMKSDYNGPRLVWPPDSAARMSAVEIEHVRALYAGMVTFADTQIGGFLDKLTRLGLMDNTIIVFTADHGAMMGEQGQFHKTEGWLRTQVTHVPLILYHPWATPGRRVEGFAQHTDIMPTLLSLVGVRIPPRVTGESLKPLLESGDSSRRERVIGGWDSHGFIRTKEFLYIGRWNAGEAYEELYELASDPLELKNVNTKYPAFMNDLHQQLVEYVEGGWSITKGTFATIQG